MRERQDDLSLSVFLSRSERRRDPKRLPRGARRGDPEGRLTWSARERSGAAVGSPGRGTRDQRCAVKVGYLRAGKPGAWRAHGIYLAREGAQREGARGLGFDATREDLDVAGTLAAWQAAGDQILWKAIVSPEQAAQLDLRAHARALIAAMERDLGTRLAWVGIDHHNTDNPHLHLLIRGCDARGRPLTLEATYVQQGIRARSEDLATRALGWRSTREIAASQERLVDQARFTELDRAILARADGDSRVAYGDRPLADGAARAHRRLEMRRLDFLGTLGLAESEGAGCWQLSPQLEPALRQLQLAGDIQKSRARHRTPLSEPGGSLVVARLTSDLHLEGRVVGTGVVDAAGQRRYTLLENPDRRVYYYLLHPAGRALAGQETSLRVGDRVVLEGERIHRQAPPQRNAPGRGPRAERDGTERAPDAAVQIPELPSLETFQQEQGRPIQVVPPLDGLVYRGQLLGYARDPQGHAYAVLDTGRELAAFRTLEQGLAIGREVRVTGHALEGGPGGHTWRLRGAEPAREHGRVR